MKATSIHKNKDSLTGKYISGEMDIELPEKRIKPKNDRWLSIIGASGNNLKDVNLNLPVGTFVSPSLPLRLQCTGVWPHAEVALVHFG